jgi:hypothetical protein
VTLVLAARWSPAPVATPTRAAPASDTVPAAVMTAADGAA